MANRLETTKRILTTMALSWTAFFIYIGWLGLFIQTDIAASLHGNVHPVITKLRIASMEETEFLGLPATRIKGDAIKHRSCGLERVNWYLHDNSGLVVPIKHYFEDEPQTRDVGLQEWEGIVIGIDVSKMDMVSATVKHSCGNFPVISQFYLGEGL